jgi:hypothetical protein
VNGYSIRAKIVRSAKGISASKLATINTAYRSSMTYFKFKPRPSKTTERQKLVVKVDIAFSEYIRLRNADSEGMVHCITCQDRHHWTDVDCGHFVKRGNHSTRWHLMNSGEQCRLCNSTTDGKEDDHAEYIDKTYGHGTADKLRRLGTEESHFSAPELQGMLDELRKEIKALKIEKLG